MIFTLLKDNITTGTFTVKPNNTETARTFISAMKQTDSVSKTMNHGFNKSKVDVINDFLRLTNIVTAINNSSYDRKIEVDLSTDFSLQKLFDLHEHFEDLGHRKRSGDPTLVMSAYEEIINLGCEMNGLIHKLESGINSGYFFQALFQKPDIVRIPLTESVIAEAVKDYRQDYMYVGYGETGKNMGHVYQINDVEVLHRKLVQPQRYILTEFFVSLADAHFDYEKYIKWCKDNKTQEEYGYDYTNPIWYAKWEVGPIVEKSWNTLENFPVYDTITFFAE
jgi:hypothetical protein